jgi:hypothetical protein
LYFSRISGGGIGSLKDTVLVRVMIPNALISFSFFSFGISGSSKMDLTSSEIGNVFYSFISLFKLLSDVFSESFSI